MISDSVVDWQELSALYERADGLEDVALAEWLARLCVENHRLLPQLQRMLDARAHIATGGFLEGLPRIEPGTGGARSDWGEGSRIGAYRLVRHIGSGGMAEVWLAERADGAFKRQVAIKLLHRHLLSIDRRDLARRFELERDILASLDHPHIAALHDAGFTADDQPWIALEYVEGQPLIAWCDAQRLSIDGRLRLFRQVLLAVSHAHANLVIHRDLKPANILVTAEGQVRLLDFGIAKLVELEGAAASLAITRDGGRPLTPQYTSPEQLRGAKLTTACDVYSLGVVLYELLCGARPYEVGNGSAAQLEVAILEAQPRPAGRRSISVDVAAARQTTASELRRAIGDDLDAVVLKALEKQPEDRYPSVEAMRADVDRWLAGRPVLARPPSVLYRARKFASRHRTGVATTALAVLLLLTTTGSAVWMAIDARRSSQRVVAARDFLLGTMAMADPDANQGSELSARDLLEVSRKKASAELHDQPELQAEVLSGIGSVQIAIGNYVSADKALAEAQAIYARLGLTKLALTATVDRAEAQFRMGAFKQAEGSIREVQADARALAGDGAVLGRVAWIKGWLAQSAHDLSGAELSFNEALRQADRTYGTTSRQYVDALRDLASVDHQLHEPVRGTERLARAKEIAGRVPGYPASDFLGIEQDLALAEFDAGKIADAADRLSRSASRCDVVLGAKDETCIFSRGRLAQVMLRSGRDTEALALVPLLMARVDDDSSPLRQGEAMVIVSRILARNGQLTAAHPIRARLAELAGADDRSFRDSSRLGSLLVLAEADVMAGDFASARKRLEHADARMRDVRTVEPELAGWQGRLEAAVLGSEGKDEEALIALRLAHDHNVGAWGAGHPLVAFYDLQQCWPLARTGRSAAALQLIDVAIPALHSGMHSQSPLVERVLRLRAQIEGGKWVARANLQADLLL